MANAKSPAVFVATEVPPPMCDAEGTTILAHTNESLILVFWFDASIALQYSSETFTQGFQMSGSSLRGDARRDAHLVNQLLRPGQVTQLTLLCQHLAQDLVGGERVREYGTEHDRGTTVTELRRQGGA